MKYDTAPPEHFRTGKRFLVLFFGEKSSPSSHLGEVGLWRPLDLSMSPKMTQNGDSQRRCNVGYPGCDSINI